MAAVGDLNRWAGSIFRPVFSVEGAAARALEANRCAPAPSLDLEAACPEGPVAGPCSAQIVVPAMGATVYASMR